jgi:hypothetical protein
MRRHNGKLLRVARAILKDDADAEHVLREAFSPPGVLGSHQKTPLIQ